MVLYLYCKCPGRARSKEDRILRRKQKRTHSHTSAPSPINRYGFTVLWWHSTALWYTDFRHSMHAAARARAHRPGCDTEVSTLTRACCALSRPRSQLGSRPAPGRRLSNLQSALQPTWPSTSASQPAEQLAYRPAWPPGLGLVRRRLALRVRLQTEKFGWAWASTFSA